MVKTRGSSRKSPPAKASGGAKKKATAAKKKKRTTSGAPSGGAVTLSAAAAAANADASSADVGNEAPIFMTPRENDFNEKTWWMVDINPIGNEETSSRQGATALVKRCMRTYGWGERKTRKVLNAYRQFIFLKKEAQDWDATIVSPCSLVDQMWHCHILDVVNYYHDMILLCGRVVGHDPDGALDYKAKQQRDKATRDLLQQHFGSYDEEIWGKPIHTIDTIDSEDDSVAITIRLINQVSEETTFKMKRTTRMINILGAYAYKKGVDMNDIRFLLDGERIEYDDTPESLDLEDGDRIDCFFHQCGC